MQQGNVGSVKKKDVEGELGRISAQMPVVHVVQRNVAGGYHFYDKSMTTVLQPFCLMS